MLDGGLFGTGIETSETSEQLAIDEQWARHNIAPAVDVFDHWRIYLVESNVAGRVLYGKTELGALVHETQLVPGECDGVLELACQEIGRLYEADKDASPEW